MHSPERAQADIERAAAAALAWAGGAPALLGGDFNVRRPAATRLRVRWAATASTTCSAIAWRRPSRVELPERGALSDHAPAIVTGLPRGDAALGVGSQPPPRPTQEHAMPRRITTVLACLALAAGAAAFAGCGDDDDSTSTPAAAPPAAPEPQGSAASGDVVEVGMKDIKFVPQEVTAKVGQKIVWTNTDGQVPHTVTATDGADFDSGNMQGGDTFEFTPKEAGTIDYVCTIHSGQTGKVTVTE